MSVSVTDNTNLIKARIENNCGIAIRLMLEDIHNHATPITPMAETKMLRTAVFKQMEGNKKGTIEWRAPYAQYQERGFTSGPVRRYTTAGTKAHFAQESVEYVMNNLIKYLRQGGVA